MNTLQIRKKWLRAFICCLIMGILSTLITLLVGDEQEKLTVGVELAQDLLWGWITYHCAFRKSGTAWLMFLLIVLPICMLMILATGFKYLGSGASLFRVFGVVFFLIIIYFWFWLNCLRLRAINLTLKNDPSANSIENM